MKKGQIYEGVIERVNFPNKGIATVEDRKVIVKNTVPGQKVSFSVSKVRKGKCEGRLLEVLEHSPLEFDAPNCAHFGICGGCIWQNLPYDEQLKLKSGQVLDLMKNVVPDAGGLFEGIKASPRQFSYRNKMEFTFGDEVKDGPLALGMHKRGSFYDIVTVDQCRIMDGDYRKILSASAEYFRDRQVCFYHRMRHTGYLRHLLVRKAAKTGEILVVLITTTQDPYGKYCALSASDTSARARDLRSEVRGFANGECENHKDEQGMRRIRVEDDLLQGWKECMMALELDGTIAGILHTKNDSVADAVKNEGTEILYGHDYFYEELLGLKFKISPFSFFQTNSLGAEVLYETARNFIGDSLEARDKIVFDLYSGTGTIAQILAPTAKKVIGVEIVEEAVEAARENAAQNGLDNCEFIAGDVLKVIDTIEEKPDFIVLDPPREGIHPKALQKIIDYGVARMIYISCKPTSLQRDLELLQARGYRVDRICCVDMFPGTGNVETVVCLSQQKPDDVIRVGLDLDELEVTPAEAKATYGEIKAYVKEHTGLAVSTLYIAQVKQKYGIIERENYNKPKSEDARAPVDLCSAPTGAAAKTARQPQCPPEKEAAIRVALEHFGMIG